MKNFVKSALAIGSAVSAAAALAMVIPPPIQKMAKKRKSAKGVSEPARSKKTHKIKGLRP